MSPFQCQLFSPSLTIPGSAQSIDFEMARNNQEATCNLKQSVTLAIRLHDALKYHCDV